jgi:hypothetical protein
MDHDPYLTQTNRDDTAPLRERANETQSGRDRA